MSFFRFLFASILIVKAIVANEWTWRQSVSFDDTTNWSLGRWGSASDDVELSSPLFLPPSRVLQVNSLQVEASGAVLLNEASQIVFASSRAATINRFSASSAPWHSPLSWSAAASDVPAARLVDAARIPCHGDTVRLPDTAFRIALDGDDAVAIGGIRREDTAIGRETTERFLRSDLGRLLIENGTLKTASPSSYCGNDRETTMLRICSHVRCDSADNSGSWCAEPLFLPQLKCCPFCGIFINASVRHSGSDRCAEQLKIVVGVDYDRVDTYRRYDDLYLLGQARRNASGALAVDAIRRLFKECRPLRKNQLLRSSAVRMGDIARSPLSSGGHMNLVLISGIVSAVVLVASLVAALFYLWRRRATTAMASSEDQSDRMELFSFASEDVEGDYEFDESDEIYSTLR